MFYKNSKGQVIGQLKEGVFRRKVKRSKHLFRMFDAWGIDKEVVNSLKKNQCVEIRIKDTESNDVYIISFDKFLDNSVTRNFETMQYFVSRKFFDMYNKDSPN